MMVLVNPGEKAPVTGTYEPIDPSGKVVAMLATMQRGAKLPDLPQGYRWRLVT